jgi:hypothetical protein
MSPTMALQEPDTRPTRTLQEPDMSSIHVLQSSCGILWIAIDSYGFLWIHVNSGRWSELATSGIVVFLICPDG